MIDQQLSDTQPNRTLRKKPRLSWFLWVVTSMLLVGAMVIPGGFLGYRSGSDEVAQLQVMDNLVALQEQYSLGIKDFHEARYDLARQRFEYVLANDPDYPGASTRLEEVILVLLSTATLTPTTIPPTITPTATRDFSPVEAIYRKAQDSFNNDDWDAVIDACIALRQQDPTYRVVDVDSLLYRALHSRGVDKIRKSSNLEGGIYDLSLAEKFGPLDATAQGWRNLARLYLIGSSFWEVYPEQAVYFFGQVASGAPFLRDASGWTARERYRASLIQYGNQLATQGQWCAAQEQFALALGIGNESQVQAQATEVSYQCYLPTQIAASQTWAPTTTTTATIMPPTLGPTSTATVTSLPTNPPTQEPSATQAELPTPTPTVMPSETIVPQPPPSDTPTPPPDEGS
jgi:hypothetical protein